MKEGRDGAESMSIGLSCESHLRDGGGLYGLCSGRRGWCVLFCYVCIRGKRGYVCVCVARERRSWRMRLAKALTEWSTGIE